MNQRKNYANQVEWGRGETSYSSARMRPPQRVRRRKIKIYDELANTAEDAVGCHVYMGGDFNARIYKRNQYYEELGEHFIEREGYMTEGIAANTRDNRNRFLDLLKSKHMTTIQSSQHQVPETTKQIGGSPKKCGDATQQERNAKEKYGTL